MIPITEESEELFPRTHFRAYGLGWSLRDYEGRKVVSHGGAIDGMRAQVALVPEEELGVVVLSNLGGQNLVTALAYRVLDAYLGAPERDWSRELLEAAEKARRRAEERERKVREGRIPGTSPSLPLERYEGVYVDSLYGEMRVERGNGGLLLRFASAFRAELMHWHGDTFQARWRLPGAPESFVTFRVSPAGEVEALETVMERDVPRPVRFRRRGEAGEGR